MNRTRVGDEAKVIYDSVLELVCEARHGECACNYCENETPPRSRILA